MSMINGDCVEVLKKMADNCVDSIVTDPPYELGFMGKKWDSTGIAYNVELWQECLRVLKPGGHLLAFGGSRTYHRMTCAIEDAGFNIRDCIMWVYGSGFPKGQNIGKGIDKLQGNKREVVGHSQYEGRRPNKWGGKENGDVCYGDYKAQPVMLVDKGNSPYEGYNTNLKPAHEPIVMARKPITENTIVKNVLKYGTGGINIDGCRVEANDMAELEKSKEAIYKSNNNGKCRFNFMNTDCNVKRVITHNLGRYPANFIHDGSDEVLELFPESKGDNGSAARFFYCAKASKTERNQGCDELEEKSYAAQALHTPKEGSIAKYGVEEAKKKLADNSTNKNTHPTLKPIKLMRYLVKLVTPPNGIVLDPFAGSGTTGIAAYQEGKQFIGIEKETEYFEICNKRIRYVITHNESTEPKKPKKPNMKANVNVQCQCQFIQPIKYS